MTRFIEMEILEKSKKERDEWSHTLRVKKALLLERQEVMHTLFDNCLSRNDFSFSATMKGMIGDDETTLEDIEVVLEQIYKKDGYPTKEQLEAVDNRMKELDEMMKD